MTGMTYLASVGRAIEAAKNSGCAMDTLAPMLRHLAELAARLDEGTADLTALKEFRLGAVWLAEYVTAHKATEKVSSGVALLQNLAGTVLKPTVDFDSEFDKIAASNGDIGNDAS